MYKIGIVSYLNSLPFRYGLESISNCELQTLVPSVISDKLCNNHLDIGLVPIATFIRHKDWNIISDYCIGSDGEVKTVLLISEKSINLISTICIDSESKSSNLLAKVICNNFWKINPEWVNDDAKCDAKIVIGDKTFIYNTEYPNIIDLSLEWKKQTGMPFVFAAWVSNKKIDSDFLINFNKSISLGVNSIDLCLKKYNHLLPISHENAQDYLKKNISFNLDEEKKLAIHYFAKLVENL